MASVRESHEDSPWLMLNYKRAAEAVGLLTPDEDKRLARLYQDHNDQDALDKLVMSHGHVALRMLRSFRYHPELKKDLLQQAYIGLRIAAEKFDTTRNVRFSTVAFFWVKASMQQYAIQNASVVRRPYINGPLASFRAAMKSFHYKLSEIDPEGIERIANHMQLPVEKVIDIIEILSVKDNSLSHPRHADTNETHEDILVSGLPNGEDIALRAQAAGLRSEWLEKAFDQLDARERSIIQYRRLSDPPLTLQALGKMHGISHERVRQIEAGAFEKIQKFMMLHTSGKGVSHAAFYDPEANYL